jgi:DNA-binding NtrC family response regulator
MSPSFSALRHRSGASFTDILKKRRSPMDDIATRTVSSPAVYPPSIVEGCAAMQAADELGGHGLLRGSSNEMLKLYHLLEKVAPTDATVLIVGETGSGKELVANTIHQTSGRNGRPFIAINCGAIPANLIEAELFGHERGSFTGAVRMNKGCFERAAGGTIFLDEITEMAPEMQVKLLRVLETGTLRRVGGSQEIGTDVRVIAATNRQPDAAVAQGLLREDLLYRLSVFPVMVPPLRDREEDVVLLAQHFLGEFNAEAGSKKVLSAATLDYLRTHSWPGNVRELKNTIHRAFIMSTRVIDLSAVPPPAAIGESAPRSDECLTFPVGIALADAEKQLILATLNHYSGNKKKTAETLGISLKTLYNRLTEYRGGSRLSMVS